VAAINQADRGLDHAHAAAGYAHAAAGS